MRELCAEIKNILLWICDYDQTVYLVQAELFCQQ